MTYTIQVHGVVPVTVPAGTFDSVYVEVDFSPAPFPGSEDRMAPIVFDVHAEYWYNEDVRFLVKSVLSASAEGRDAYGGDSFRFGYRSSMQLRDFDLARGAEEPAPPIAVDEPSPEPMPAPFLEITSDTEFPVNVAPGPVPVTFSLREGDMGPYRGDGIIRPTSDDDAPLDYDRETYQVVWILETWRGSDVERDEAAGDTFLYNFTRGGAYNIRAELRPRECGGPWLGSAYGMAWTYWEKSFKVPVDAGLQRTIPVGEFPVEGNAADAFASWTMTPTLGTQIDKGRPVFKAPDGRLQTYPYSSSQRQVNFNPYPSGTWGLSWDTEGVTVGDDAVLTIRINYGAPHDGIYR